MHSLVLSKLWLVLFLSFYNEKAVDAVVCHGAGPGRCDGSDVLTGIGDNNRCCRGDGVYFQLSAQTEECTLCIVFGWIAGERVGTTGMNRVTVYESSAIQAQLPLGFLKGASRVSPSALVSFSIGVTSGTAVEGVDFRVNQTQCSPIRTANGICNVFVDILDDGIQDSGEMFTLTLQGITDTQNTFLSTGSYTIPTLEVIIEEKPPESTVSSEATQSPTASPGIGETPPQNGGDATPIIVGAVVGALAGLTLVGTVTAVIIVVVVKVVK